MKRSTRLAHVRRALRYGRRALKSIAGAIGIEGPPIDLTRTSAAFGTITYEQETGLFTHTHPNHPSDLCDCAVGYEGHADDCAARPYLCDPCGGTGCCPSCGGDGTNGVPYFSKDTKPERLDGYRNLKESLQGLADPSAQMPEWHRDERFSTDAEEVVWNGVATQKPTLVEETPTTPTQCIVCRGFHYQDQHCAPPLYDLKDIK